LEQVELAYERDKKSFYEMERASESMKTDYNKIREEKNNILNEMDIQRKVNKTLESDKNKL